MNKYEMIVESLQEQVDAGVLTLENAKVINDLSYEKYITEKMSPEKKDKFTNDVKKIKSIVFANHHKVKTPKNLPSIRPVDEENEDELLEKFKTLNLGIVAFDDSNYLMYSFEKKKFIFFDHECTLKENMTHVWSDKKAIKWMTELFESSGSSYKFKYQPFK